MRRLAEELNIEQKALSSKTFRPFFSSLILITNVIHYGFIEKFITELGTKYRYRWYRFGKKYDYAVTEE